MHYVTSLLAGVGRLQDRRPARDWWAYFGAFGDDFFGDDGVGDDDLSPAA
jgi:hypothetical protein